MDPVNRLCADGFGGGNSGSSLSNLLDKQGRAIEWN